VLPTPPVECRSAFADRGASASDFRAASLSGAIQVAVSASSLAVALPIFGYNVNDGHGNHASSARTVHVVDTTPPTLTLSGSPSMTIECHSLFADPGASATDLCAGDLSTAIQVFGSADANAVGDYTPAYNVND